MSCDSKLTLKPDEATTTGIRRRVGWNCRLAPRADRDASAMPVIGVITARTLRCPSSARSTLKKINNKMLLYTASVSIRPSVPHDRAMAQNESVSEANFTPRLRVLVADDHRDTVLRLGILLRSEGYDVRLAENGAQALAEAAQFHPDVALLDI